MSNVVNVSTASWEVEVVKSDVPVVVDFWAPWCGPCRTVAPEIDKLAAKANGSVKFVKVNIDEERDLAMRYGVMSIPTIAKFVSGEVAAMAVGAQGASALSRELALGL